MRSLVILSLAFLLAVSVGNGISVNLNKSVAMFHQGNTKLEVAMSGGNGDYTFNYYNLPSGFRQQGKSLIIPRSVNNRGDRKLNLRVVDSLDNSMDTELKISINNNQLSISE